ncbi:malonyl-CoA decarboxylase [Halomonas sp. MCCC 1A17488]|uniref:Malonyl-CoA decarboxylase n=1 Tax=Billgrantia sulfidoxydans TaxID=2733484 RepID=A0ABX7W9H0_9GAMM|nr:MULTISPECIES: malonyl-CoA decarboxylase [Halomonas]MCE8017686.1 malonyl-CoA decarboxylase [Halomonas sp. MCCC 1A17488]MCG3241019.1 malonyl-CoA decarboxylase [Halomonas sp. MCCC 1A17488]QPP48885.1 malonyl-CoA decarboxylase [Halomonas sp. SS10-MC5]QTP56212.1 malonyl-CoA decarboxylase [Halomonas sulfidoxydans]
MNMTFLQELFNSITQRDARLWRRQGEFTAPDHAQLLDACRELLESDGEASSISLASRALTMYHRLTEDERTRFFEGLASDFAAEPARIDAAYEAYREQRDNPSLHALFEACEPRRQELFRRLNLASDGTHALVRMREGLLERIRERPELDAIDADFAHLFGSWFNRGFLMLKRIDWNTPASILEKIIRYEAVHEIRDWDDLRRRLDARDRRCFAFFHPAIGDEPLIFVEVALCKGLPDRIQPILSGESAGERDIDDPEAADSAAFFGISNCQTGLRGISFGNFLIKQVVQELKLELPQLKHFVTLSPVPGFAHWLAERRDDEGLPDELRQVLHELDAPDWHLDPARSERLKAVVKPLAARYLVEEKNARGLPLNPVARFHLGNGAELHRVNWLGDTSPKGVKQAAGLMVNYLYVLDDIERNHENYTANATVACSNEVRDLNRRARKMAKGEPAK